MRNIIISETQEAGFRQSFDNQNGDFRKFGVEIGVEYLINFKNLYLEYL